MSVRYRSHFLVSRCFGSHMLCFAGDTCIPCNAFILVYTCMWLFATLMYLLFILPALMRETYRITLSGVCLFVCPTLLWSHTFWCSFYFEVNRISFCYLFKSLVDLSWRLYILHWQNSFLEVLSYSCVNDAVLCYVAVCNNYAICNTLQTALNCNAVCNTLYFKLRCEGNAIWNVLQIASKFYHLKILKRRKNWSTAKCIASIISYSEFS